jgi:F-type H+-transporting ATPase subunit epsilon
MSETAATTQDSLRVVVVTPERALLDETADFVALPMYDGELGALPGRAPLIGRLGCGELRIRRGGVTERYYIDGGFAQIRANEVTVLTSKALKPSEINAEAAQQSLAAANSAKATTPEAQTQRSKNQERARAQLHLANKTAGTAEAAHH